MYAVIDIETTGGRAIDKITEIAVYVFDGKKITDEFSTLINPEQNIPYFITKLTGISNEMVADAPKFYEVAKKIVEITANKIIVGHNVGFDYGFIRNEFKQLGFDFKRKTLCTVKLSRKLLPGMASYSLGNICKEIDIKIKDRHRATGDALATVKLFEHILSLHGEKNELFSSEKINALSDLHPQLTKQKIEKIPEDTGVYYFYNDKKDLIYVGKSKNIYKRVLTHLRNTKNKKAYNLKDQIADIDFEITGSELVALLVESEQIKANKPLFNRAQRRTMFNYGLYLYENKNGYLIFKVEKNNGQTQLPVTSFDNQESARRFLNTIVDKYTLCQKLCDLYDSAEHCFNYHVKNCNGACMCEEDARIYNHRVSEMLRYYSFSQSNFFVIDKGRSRNERTVVKIANNSFIGWGYITIEDMNDIENLHSVIKKCPDNRDVQQIIRSHLRRYKYLKVIPF